MAKSKSFFGLRSGSTKTLTFQVSQGRQITKDRVWDVKNPRTQLQMGGRCLMATASAAYAAMKEIVDHSFEGITYGQNNMSEFIRRNYALLKDAQGANPEKFGYNPYRDRHLYPGRYLVSAGSVSSVITRKTNCDASYTPDDGTSSFSGAVTIPGWSNTMTCEQALSAMGLAVGDMMTFVFMYPIDAQTYYGFGFIRFKVIASSTKLANLANMSACFEIESNLGHASFGWNNGEFSGSVRQVPIRSANEETIPFALIHSRKSANGWLRSTESIQLPANIDVGETFASALATYPIGASYVLNGGAVQ